MSITSCGLGQDKLGAASCDLAHDSLRAFYSPKETEAILNISHATCYRLIAAGKLDARKLGGKTLITVESIERLVAELPKAGKRD